MSYISWDLIEMIFNNVEFDSFEDIKRYYDMKEELQEKGLVEFKDKLDIIVKNDISLNWLKKFKEEGLMDEFKDKFDIIVGNKVSLDWLKEFKDKGLMEFKDYIGVIIKLGLDLDVLDKYKDKYDGKIDIIYKLDLDFDVLVKYKEKYDNKVDVIMNCLYEEYNTSDENRKLVDELDYEGKKQVIDNLVKVIKKVDRNKLKDNIYNGDLEINELGLVGDLMFMRVLNIDKVNGGFNCSSNKNLRSLKGGPMVVSRYNCRDCNLISLEGNHNVIDGYFYCFK